MTSRFALLSSLCLVVLIAGVSQAQSVKGTGTQGHIPIWIDSGTIGNSDLTQTVTPNGTEVNLPGTVKGIYVTAGRTVTAGGDINAGRNVTVSGVLSLSATADANTGVVRLSGQPFIHSFRGTFLGNFAGNFASSGVSNIGIGSPVLNSVTSGSDNVAVGDLALALNSNGNQNTALGNGALYGNSSGGSNTAIGWDSLFLSTGDNNIGLGPYAAQDLVSGSNNIYIGNKGPQYTFTENGGIHIGTHGTHTATYIAGIDTSPLVGSVVTVTSAGRLGVYGSSVRFKQDINDMGQTSANLMRLRPVTFRYKPEYADGNPALHHGLIAEEVAKVYPNLVQYDKEGKPFTVLYNELSAMLLNELQKQQQMINKQQAAIDQQQQKIEAQRIEVKQQQNALEIQRARLAITQGHLAALAARLVRLEQRSHTGSARSLNAAAAQD